MPVINLIVGVVLLLFGRRLFWVFVGAAGFAAGLYFARDQLAIKPEWVAIAIAVGAGLLGAVLALFLQKVAIGFAGFCAGGYLAAMLLLRTEHQALAWIGFIAGGILGMILLLVVFDWALMFLSSFTGAALIVEQLNLEPMIAFVVFIALTVFGIILQSNQRKPKPKPERGE